VGRAAYLIDADGGRLVHRLIGVEYEGLGMITQTATLYVSADFSRCGGSRRADSLDLLAASGSSGGDRAHGPARWGPGSVDEHGWRDELPRHASGDP
jgi:hypothetical protein